MEKTLGTLLLGTLLLPIANAQELIFRSGFEPTTKMLGNLTDSNTFTFTGSDYSYPDKNSWVKDLNGHKLITKHGVHYYGGDTAMRVAKLVEDPVDSTNSVMEYCIKYPNQDIKGRIQMRLGFKEGMNEFTSVTRVFLPESFEKLKNYNLNIPWLTPFELWDQYYQNERFRITLTIAKYKTGPVGNLNFRLKSDYTTTSGKKVVVWDMQEKDYPVPLRQWMKWEFYVRQGDANTGQFYFAVTPEGGQRTVVFNVKNWTKHPDKQEDVYDGYDSVNPLKLYTKDTIINYCREQGTPLNIFFDDFSFWLGDARATTPSLHLRE